MSGRRFRQGPMIPSRGIPVQVPIVGQQQRQQEPPKGAHRYYIPMAVERGGVTTFESFTIMGPAPITTATQFAEIAEWAKGQLAERFPELPPPSKVTCLTPFKLAFIPQDVLDRLEAQAREDASKAAADGESAPQEEPVS